VWIYGCPRRRMYLFFLSFCELFYVGRCLPLVKFFRPNRMHAVHRMRPVATDVARSGVCLSVRLLVTRVCCAKTARPIEMLFGGLTHRGTISWGLRSIRRMHSQPRWVTNYFGLLMCRFCEDVIRVYSV